MGSDYATAIQRLGKEKSYSFTGGIFFAELFLFMKKRFEGNEMA